MKSVNTDKSRTPSSQPLTGSMRKRTVIRNDHFFTQNSLGFPMDNHHSSIPSGKKTVSCPGYKNRLARFYAGLRLAL